MKRFEDVDWKQKLMKAKISRRKRVLRWLAIGIVVILLGLYIGLPTGMAFYATRSHQSNVDAAPDGFDEITLTTADGVKIAAWYAPPENGESGAVIILVHGAGNSRDGVRGHARFLHEAGFGVLAIDLRGHGESGGQPNLMGWNGTLDVGAAVDFLATQSDVTAIGGLGSSLGGEVLLGAAAEYPQIQAIVSDGATSRCVEEYRSLPKNRPLYRNVTHRVFTLAVGLFSGDDPPLPLVDAMMDAEETRFFFIAGAKNADEVEFNEYFLEQVGERGSLWVVPDVGHTGGYSRYPDEYEQRVIEFFTATLLEDVAE